MAAPTDPTSLTAFPLADIPQAVAEGTSSLTLHPALLAALTERKLLIFLDYDGTLSPIADRPQDAVFSDQGRAIVKDLARHLPTAVISGRDLPDVERLVGLEELVYAGSHGYDIRLPQRKGAAPEESHSLAPIPENITPLLDRVEKALLDGFDDIDGAIVERKTFSIAAHYRLVADAHIPTILNVVTQIVADTPELQQKGGKKVCEIVPAIDWDKGKCVLALLDHLGANTPEHLAIFIGDDRTDEDAFLSLRGQTGKAHGFGMIVADPADPDFPQRSSQALYRLSSTDQTLDFLQAVTRIVTQK